MPLDTTTLEGLSGPVTGARSPEKAGGLSGLFLGALLPVVLAAAWEIAVASGVANGRLVPPPSRIFDTLAELARTGELFVHIKATTLRVAAGFAAGTLAGTLLGAL